MSKSKNPKSKPSGKAKRNGGPRRFGKWRSETISGHKGGKMEIIKRKGGVAFIETGLNRREALSFIEKGLVTLEMEYGSALFGGRYLDIPAVKALDDRRKAQAFKAWAAIAKRDDIKRRAAAIQTRAEMLICDLYQALSPEERGRGHKIVIPDNDFTGGTLRQWRHIYPACPGERERCFQEANRLKVPANHAFFKKRKVEQRKEAARAERIEAVKRRPRIKGASVYNLPIADLEKKLAPESVDIVFTDPLYNEPGIPTYSELSRFAGKVLKPGGSLLALSGGEFLPKIISRICEDSRLKWNFLLTLDMTGGPTAWRPPPRVNVSSKPILWLVKGKYKGPAVNNTIKAPHLKKAPSKERHPFAQSPKAMYEIIRRFDPKGKIVCDPFCGLGSLPLAAKALGAGVIASDIKKEHADEARRWLRRAEDKGGDLAIGEMEIELSK